LEGQRSKIHPGTAQERDWNRKIKTDWVLIAIKKTEMGLRLFPSVLASTTSRLPQLQTTAGSSLFVGSLWKATLGSQSLGGSCRGIRSFTHVEPNANKTLPDTTRFPNLPKVPGEVTAGIPFPRGTKDLRRFFGEENIHTELLLKQFAIVAVSGGQLRWKHFESFKRKFNANLNQGSFAILRIDPPYRPMTNKRGKRMGGGKGKVKTYGTSVRAGRVLFEVGGKVTWDECRSWLTNLARRMPFESIAVTHEMLESLKTKENELELQNLNPYTLEWFLRNNIMDCTRHFSPYDLKLNGKFTYRDRHNNRKWQLARREPYHSAP